MERHAGFISERALSRPFTTRALHRTPKRETCLALDERSSLQRRVVREAGG
jgi:hypothetical protein